MGGLILEREKKKIFLFLIFGDKFSSDHESLNSEKCSIKTFKNKNYSN